MRYIIFAIVCLAGTTFAADVCSIECSQVSGNWTGNSSVIVDVGSSTEIIYDVNYKILVVLNTRENLLFATNGKFLLVLNIQTGGYILIDYKTGYAVYEKITITFKNTDGSIDYTKLIIEVNILLTKYESITSSTASSFNFTLIIVGFYSFEFNLSTILSGRDELVTALNESFSAWFRLIQIEIRSGSISIARGIWGFFIVMIELDVDTATAFFAIISTSIDYYRAVEVQIMVEIVRIIRYNIRTIIEFAMKWEDVLSTSANMTIGSAIQWAADVRNNPINVNLTIAGSTYIFTVTRSDSMYVIRFAIKGSNDRNIDIKIVFVQNVLFVINSETNVSMAFYRRSFVLTNTTSSNLFVGTIRMLSVNGAYVTDAQLGIDIRGQNYAAAAKEVIALVNKYESSASINFAELRTAMLSGSISEVAKIVGSSNASAVFMFYTAFFSETDSGTFGGIVIGVFGYRYSVVSIFFSRIIGVIAAGGGQWSFFYKTTGLAAASSSSSGGISIIHSGK